MAKLMNFIYCINAERIYDNNGQGENINAIGILPALTPEYVPGAFSFSIIFTIFNMDISVNNTIQIIFSKQNEKVIVDSGNVTLPPMSIQDKIELPSEYRGLNMSMDFRNVVFEEEGVYNTRVLLNGELLGDNPIYVKGKR